MGIKKGFDRFGQFHTHFLVSADHNADSFAGQPFFDRTERFLFKQIFGTPIVQLGYLGQFFRTAGIA